ncbi:MAG TPA: hypothetical protein VEI52_05415 [Terriglobales bacterium]|nr:hypothetical protein [Terriglobales bacterium]
MSVRGFALVSAVLALISVAPAKDKKKFLLPNYVLQAHTVYVVIDPDAGVSITNPNENRTAQEDVEKALSNWGRLSPVMSPQTADLVISIRKGHGRNVNPTIGGIPNDRPVIMQPTDGGIRVGAQQGTPPPVSDTTVGPPPSGPHPRTEIGSADDVFAVYRGQVEYPLDSPPVWRYTAKDALNSPNVPAVAQFRKVIEEAEKQQQAKKP